MCLHTVACSAILIWNYGRHCMFAKSLYLHFEAFYLHYGLGEKIMPETSEMKHLGMGVIFSLEEGPATHSSILAWRIPWTEEAGGLQQSIGLQRFRHDWSDSHMHTCDFSTNFSSLHLVTRSHVRCRRKSESSRKGWEQQFYCLRRQCLHCFLTFMHVLPAKALTISIWTFFLSRRSV